jgi:hypothetical protein
VTTIEDQLRELFATVDSPEVSPPGVERLRRRARRHRLEQATASLGVLAIVIAAVVGGIAVSRGSQGSTNLATSPPGVTAIPAHIAGFHVKLWLVGDKTVNGQTLTAATYRDGHRTCLVDITTQGSQQCFGAGWSSTVAQYGVYQDAGLTQVTGRVPLAARAVTVNVDNLHVTVPALLTPSSDTERYFTAFLTLPPRDSASEFIGVTDTEGQAVAQASIPPANLTPGVPTHVPGLPGKQVGFPIVLRGPDTNTRAVVYRQGASDCVAIARGNQLLDAATCKASAPTSARGLVAVTLPDGIEELVGDAPRWADTVDTASNLVTSEHTLGEAPGIPDRRFWSAVAIHGTPPGNVIATCTVGANCAVVRPFVPPTPG